MISTTQLNLTQGMSPPGKISQLFQYEGNKGQIQPLYTIKGQNKPIEEIGPLCG